MNARYFAAALTTGTLPYLVVLTAAVFVTRHFALSIGQSLLTFAVAYVIILLWTHRVDRTYLEDWRNQFLAP